MIELIANEHLCTSQFNDPFVLSEQRKLSVKTTPSNIFNDKHDGNQHERLLYSSNVHRLVTLLNLIEKEYRDAI